MTEGTDPRVSTHGHLSKSVVLGIFFLCIVCVCGVVVGGGGGGVGTTFEGYSFAIMCIIYMCTFQFEKPLLKKCPEGTH